MGTFSRVILFGTCLFAARVFLLCSAAYQHRRILHHQPIFAKRHVELVPPEEELRFFVQNENNASDEDVLSDRFPRAKALKCEGNERNTMMVCLTKSLSEFALNLAPVYADLEKLKCDAHNSISKCWSKDKKSPCTMQDAKRVAEALTDMMNHRDMNSTFLYGVLALDPICEAKKAKTLIAEHYQCLHKFHEGKQMLKEVDDIHVQISAGGDKATLCQKLTDTGAKVSKAVNGHCNSEPIGQLMCKAVSSPFLTLHPDIFDSSCVPCPEKEKAEQVVGSGAEKAPQNGEETPTKTAANALPLHSSLLLLLAVSALFLKN